MRKTLLKIAVMVGLMTALSPLMLGQTGYVKSGTMNIAINPNFSLLFASQGITFTSKGKSVVDHKIEADIPAGTLNLEDGTGKIDSTGSMDFSNGSDNLRILDLGLDTADAFPRITGVYFLNGFRLGRHPVFDGDKGSPYVLPMVFGVNTFTQLMISPSLFFRSLLSGVFKTATILNYAGLSTSAGEVKLVAAPVISVAAK